MIPSVPEATGIVGVVLLVLSLGALLIGSGRRGALAKAWSGRREKKTNPAPATEPLRGFFCTPVPLRRSRVCF